MLLHELGELCAPVAFNTDDLADEKRRLTTAYWMGRRSIYTDLYAHLQRRKDTPSPHSRAAGPSSTENAPNPSPARGTAPR
jgi:hypothetical protein